MLLWKFLIGSALLMLLTVASLGLLYHMKGRELQYAYLTLCYEKHTTNKLVEIAVSCRRNHSNLGSLYNTLANSRLHRNRWKNDGFVNSIGYH